MGRAIVITGCSSGFGRSAAERLARVGDRVDATMRAVAGKNEEKAGELRDVAAEEGLDLRVLELDVTSDASVAKAAARVLAESGAPDAVINNAGQMYVGLSELFTADELARQLDINVVGVDFGVRAVNEALGPHEEAVLELMGLKSLATLRKKEER